MPARKPDRRQHWITLALHSPPRPQWIGLTVKRHATQGADRAIVEFVARYKANGRAFKLHETSRFVREDGRWLYVAGDVAESA